MAEAFCRWDDEKTGLNPFLPVYPSTKGIANIIKRYIIGTIFLVVRLPFFLFFFVLLLLSQLLGVILIGNPLKRLYWNCVVSPICRMLLFVLGVFNIKISYGEAQKLRIRSVVNANNISLDTINNSDIVISNYTGYLQVLIYASRISDRFAFVTQDGLIVERSLLSALWYSMYPSQNAFSEKGKTIDQCHSYLPLVLFAEGLPTNNRTVLSFLPLSTESYSVLSPSSIHLFSISYQYSYVPGSYLVGGPIIHMLSLLMQMSLSVNICWIASNDLELLTPPATQEVKAKPKQTLLTISRLNNRGAAVQEKEETKEVVSTNVEKNNQYFYETRYPELIAAMIQTKVVGLTRKDGFNFVEYYDSRRK